MTSNDAKVLEILLRLLQCAIMYWILCWTDRYHITRAWPHDWNDSHSVPKGQRPLRQYSERQHRYFIQRQLQYGRPWIWYARHPIRLQKHYALWTKGTFTIISFDGIEDIKDIFYTFGVTMATFCLKSIFLFIKSIKKHWIHDTRKISTNTSYTFQLSLVLITKRSYHG